jgi:hypothetical protein
VRVLRGGLHRLDDVVVARAAAEVAGQGVADLGLARVGLRFSRSTEAMIIPGVQ